VDLITLTHPLVGLLGFDAGGQTRAVGTRRTPGIRLGDRLGTVPALAGRARAISTNHGIARFLDARHPDRRLLPADPARRAGGRGGRALGQRDAARWRPAPGPVGDDRDPEG
jgi:glutathione S-transferase